MTDMIMIDVTAADTNFCIKCFHIIGHGVRASYLCTFLEVIRFSNDDRSLKLINLLIFKKRA